MSYNGQNIIIKISYERKIIWKTERKFHMNILGKKLVGRMAFWLYFILFF